VEPCELYFYDLEEAAARGEPLAPELAAKVAACPSCSAHAERLGALVATLAAAPAPVAPERLAAATLAAVREQAPKRATGIRLFLRPMATAAAGFAFVVVSVLTAGGALIVSAAINSSVDPVATPSSAAPATKAPATPRPTRAPATPTVAPATPAPTPAPPIATPTPTPAPTDLPRRTPEPASPSPAGSESPAASESTAP